MVFFFSSPFRVVRNAPDLFGCGACGKEGENGFGAYLFMLAFIVISMHACSSHRLKDEEMAQLCRQPEKTVSYLKKCLREVRIFSPDTT